MKKIITLIFLVLIVIGTFSFFISLVTPSVTAKGISMKLLSVAEVNGTRIGNIANLYVEAKPGNGRVFIDTFPLTKLDTQISTRFAKETACKFLNRNCDYVDFFYTLRSEAPLLGGPSAGASVAVITTALIDNVALDDKTAMTGTINSGGIIGQVSGIKYKIDAASQNGIIKVLIPYGETNYTYEEKLGNETYNITIDYVEYGNNLGIEVIYVKNLNEAMYYFTGKKYESNKTMFNIAENICKDAFAYELKYRDMNLQNINLSDFSNTTNSTLMSNSSINSIKDGLRLVNESLKAYVNDNFYSAASFCFGANIRFNYIDLLEKFNESDKEELIEKLLDLQNDVDVMMDELDVYELRTITDLQAFMVVRERLLETNEQIKLAYSSLSNDDFESFLYRFSYASERFRTAKLWSEFFNKPGKDLKINEDNLRESCIRKISETQEKIEYVKLTLPLLDFTSTYEGISRASSDLNNGEYALCLFKASKAKAEVDLFISALGPSDFNSLVNSKIEMSKSLISKQQKSDLFPILGYSYYEYAVLLKDDDPSSSLLYSEYALELSDLDLYFGVKGKPYIIIDWYLFIYFFLGLFSGVSVTLLIWRYNNRKFNSKKFKKK
jgi:uncharacterized protein